jgi:hypothetical protein
MLIAIVLNVIVLDVMAPEKQTFFAKISIKFQFSEKKHFDAF